MSNNLKFKTPIPPGYQIFESDHEIYGLRDRRKNGLKFINGTNQSLNFQPEPENRNDSNAIAIYGTVTAKKLFFLTSTITLHLGYIDKRSAAHINDKNFENKVKARLKSSWLGDTGGMTIRFDIMLPKELMKKEKAATKEQEKTIPATTEQKAILKHCGVKIKRGLKKTDAQALIKVCDQSKVEEWEEIESIYEDLSDAEVRRDYEIKKIPKKLFLEIVLEELERTNYSSVYEIEESLIFEEAISRDPNLKRS
jgi:hypothetical protein